MINSSNRIILLGGSAGGLDAVMRVLAKLDAGLPTAVIVVLHLGEGPAQSIENKIKKAGHYKAAYVREGEPIQPGKIYIAPPGYHTLVRNDSLHLSNGPRVNLARPAIDLTFRSAAVAYGAAAIGVILSGMLDDGTAGLYAVARCGGLTVVQEPEDALYPDMPKNALACVQADHLLPATEIGGLLSHLVRVPAPPTIAIPDDIQLENNFDMSTVDDMSQMDQLGSQVPLGCPECGGPLWEIKGKGPLRYRCHIGHSVNARILLQEQNEEIEQSLWVALRTLEERARMQEKLARWEEESGRESLADSFYERANESHAHAERIRQLLSQMRSLPQSPTLLEEG